MRGYFGIGVENINKPFNVGNLFRSAHAFGASFIFTIAATYQRTEGAQSDTSDSLASIPFYDVPSLSSLSLPRGCSLVGVELQDNAVELPSFNHPRCAAYVLGPEKASLSPALTARCSSTRTRNTHGRDACSRAPVSKRTRVPSILIYGRPCISASTTGLKEPLAPSRR